MVEPLSRGPAGIRNKAAARSISSVVCCVVKWWTADEELLAAAKSLGDLRKVGVSHEVGPLDHEQEVLELLARCSW